jgi:hypothetical protein
MPSALSLLPTMAIAAVTTTVSVAAAMGGVQTLLPAAAHNSIGAHVATVAPSAPNATASGSGAAQAATAVAVHSHQQAGSAASTPSSTARATALAEAAAEPTDASATTCTAKQLPTQANGVGPRCDPGPPTAVPGKGDPAGGQGQGHTSPAPEPAAIPGNQATPAPAATPASQGNQGNQGNPAGTAPDPTPAPHGSDQAPTP